MFARLFPSSGRPRGPGTSPRRRAPAPDDEIVGPHQALRIATGEASSQMLKELGAIGPAYFVVRTAGATLGKVTALHPGRTGSVPGDPAFSGRLTDAAGMRVDLNLSRLRDVHVLRLPWQAAEAPVMEFGFDSPEGYSAAVYPVPGVTDLARFRQLVRASVAETVPVAPLLEQGAGAWQDEWLTGGRRLRLRHRGDEPASGPGIDIHQTPAWRVIQAAERLGQPLEFTLSTASLSASAEFCPCRIDVNGQVLAVSDRRTAVYLDLERTCRIHLSLAECQDRRLLEMRMLDDTGNEILTLHSGDLRWAGDWRRWCRDCPFLKDCRARAGGGEVFLYG